MTVSKSFLALVVFCAGLALPAQAAKTSPARILRVASTSEVTTVAAQGLNNLAGRNMPKFLDQMERVQEQIRVSWEAPRGSWTGLTEIRLEYRVEDSDDVRGLVKKYAETTTGRHQATFTIPYDETLSAWRIRLVQDRNILDEKTSGSWK